MTNLSTKWKKLVVWFTGYVNVIAFILAGGYIYLKSEDDDIRHSCKTVLALSASFTGLELVRGLIYNFGSLFNASYEFLSALSKVSTVIAILKVICFVTLFILDMVGKKIRFD